MIFSFVSADDSKKENSVTSSQQEHGKPVKPILDFSLFKWISVSEPETPEIEYVTKNLLVYSSIYFTNYGLKEEREYIYDEYGRLKETIIYDVKGEFQKSLETKYDDHGNIIEEYVYDEGPPGIESTNAGKIFKLTYKYDYNSNNTFTKYSYEDEKLRNISKFENDVLIKSEDYNSKGNVIVKRIFQNNHLSKELFFNSKGELIVGENFNNNSQIIKFFHEIKYEYDKNNNLSVKKIKYSDNTFNVEKYIYEYSQDNILLSSRLEIQTDISKNPSNITGKKFPGRYKGGFKKYTYHQNNKLKSVIWFTDEEHKINEQQFNENGQIISDLWFNIKTDKIKSGIEYSYNDHNNLILEKQYNDGIVTRTDEYRYEDISCIGK